MINQVFGKLTVIALDSIDSKYRKKWLCKCECGNTKSIRQDALVKNITSSCGCITKNRLTTHGDSRSRLYSIYTQMKKRCYSPSHTSYAFYGDKGITICSNWLNSFQEFKDWAINTGYKDDLTIDRIDSSKGYYPDNCRWTTQTVQNRNKSKQPNRNSKFIGVTTQGKKWRAYITLDSNTIHLGQFLTEEEAAKCRDNYIIANKLEGFTLNNI